jgi:hypothetical protein
MSAIAGDVAASRNRATDMATLVELVAQRVVELLQADPSTRDARLVDAATLARLLGVTRSYVYGHAAELGGVRLGAGSRPRWRFDVRVARVELDATRRRSPHDCIPAVPRARPIPRSVARNTPLLPIRPRLAPRS